MSSDRFRARWTGEETVDPEMDFDIDLPRGRCGQGGDAEVRVTWRPADDSAGEWRTSTHIAKDRYGSVESLLDRGCAERTMTEAADVTVGAPRTEGAGAQSVFVLPVTFTPTGSLPDVTFDGWEGTVLFRLAPGTPTWPDVTPRAMVGEPVTVDLRLLPARCDPHALADDKVGSLFRVHVAASDVPDDAAYFLPLDKEQKTALYDFLPFHCGWE